MLMRSRIAVGLRLGLTGKSLPGLRWRKGEGNEKRMYSKPLNPAESRKPIQWQHPDFYNEKNLEQEMRRVFDVCHGCRACFNLCDSFPTLFSLVDQSPTQELDSVPSSEFKKVADDCTLCDMCYMSSCPYVPPHSLNIDFPHMILRYRAQSEQKENNSQIDFPNSPVAAANAAAVPFFWPHAKEKQHVLPETSTALAFSPTPKGHQMLTNTDALAKMSQIMPSLVNKLLEQRSFFRQLLHKANLVHQNSILPSYVSKSNTFMAQAFKQRKDLSITAERKVVIYATCLANYNDPNIGLAAKNVLELNGVHVEVTYSGCCGMPQFESGDLKQVANRAAFISADLRSYIEKGFQVLSVVASCTLMMKKEWPLLLPENKDVELLSKNVFDVTEYIVSLDKQKALKKEELRPIESNISLHHACHERAQNIGFKSHEMLKLIPDAQINTVKRCSGHGGSWGVRTDKFESAMKVGKPAISQSYKHELESLKENKKVHFISSDCPLAATHLRQGVEELKGKEDIKDIVTKSLHPIEILALSYRVHPDQLN